MIGSLRSVAARLRALTGWRRFGAGILLGAIGAAALPPSYVLPGLIVSLTGFVWLLDGAESKKRAFLTGWAWGIGYFATGMYWVANAFLVYPEKHAVFIPLALFGLGAGFGAQTGFMTLLLSRVWTGGTLRIVLFACGLTLIEWVRGWFLTGFPWNWPGYVWDFSDGVMQSVSLFGVLGLTFLTVLFAAAPAVLADGTAKPWRPFAALTVVFAALWGWGVWRLAETPMEPVDGVRLRLVQGNIKQTEKWDPALRQQHLMTQAQLSRSEGYEKVTHVIWPETAAYYSLDHDQRARDFIAASAPPGGVIITGSPRTTPRGVGPLKLWNSLFAVTDSGDLVGVYDKAHLVPFGEYTPDWMPLGNIATEGVDFSPGSGPRTLTLPGAPPVGPQICYEIIFPGAVTDPNDRPGWLLNLTNDAWYGVSSGPYQHYAITRARAIEEGLPVVRVAGTGISGVIDPLGRTVARIGLNRQGIVDSPLPQAMSAPTFFAQTGNAAPLIAIIMIFIVTLTVVYKNKLYNRLKSQTSSLI